MNTKIVKKLVVISLFLPSICTARPALLIKDKDIDTINPFFHGFYVGANVAATSNTINNQLTFNPNVVQNAALYTRNQTVNGTQVQPGFLVGYEYLRNLFHYDWLLSGEFQANFIKSNINMSSSDYINNSVAANSQYAVQGRVGIALTENDNILYGLIGGSRTQVTVNTIFNNTNITVGALGKLQMNPMSTSNSLTGLKLGLGYEKRFTNHLSLRVDYSHTQYGSFNLDLNDPQFADIMPNPLGLSRTKLSTDMFGVTVMAIS